MLFLRSRFKAFLLTIFLTFIITVNFLPQTQRITTEYIDHSLERAVISFGIAKGLNAIISVAQGTELAATPAGIGVNFAIGELLDPINDMVERFSWVMLASSVSLGIQKTLTLILGTTWIQLFLALLWIFWFYALLRKKDKIAAFTLKIAVFLLILRFCLPFFAIINQNLHNAFLASEYEKSTLALKETSDHAKALQENKPSDSSLSFWEMLKKSYKSATDSLNVKKRITELTSKLNDTFNHILALITLFIIETIIFPLLFLYLLLKLLKKSGLSKEKSDALIEWFHTKTMPMSPLNKS